MKRITEYTRYSGGILPALKNCNSYSAIERLATIEDILGDDYDLDYLRNLIDQRMTMREDVAERMKLVRDIPLDRLRELVNADRDERYVILPNLDKRTKESIADSLQDVFNESNVNSLNSFYTFSEPKYKCPKCTDGNMRENLSIVLTSLPPKKEYRCDVCGYIEYHDANF